jgi:hypothetical protein
MREDGKVFDKFKRFLVVNNIKQKELAEKLGRSEGFINNVLNGRGGEFSLDELRCIKYTYEIQINEYF